MVLSGYPLCNLCKRLSKFHVCEAYPNGIPDAVYFAGHIFPKPGDGGLQFIPLNQSDYKLFEETTKEEEDDSYEFYRDHYKDGRIIIE